jgi:hypothetical protein
MSKIKEQTMNKIAKIAKAAWDQYGVEICDLSNYEYLIKKISRQLDIPLSRLTLQNHIDKITFTIKQLERSNLRKIRSNAGINLTEKDLFESGIEDKADWVVNAEKQKKEEEKPVRTLVYSINYYSDGTYEKIKPAVEPVKPVSEYVLYLGLFDYNDGKLIVQKGGYKGCNIRNKQSILQYFKTMKRFENWCVEKMNDVFSGKLIPNPDTPRDMETLNKIINELEIKRRLGNY